MLKYYYFLLLSFAIAGCSLTDSDQPIPSYLTINNVDIFTTPNEGAPTHKITDVWVYADNELLGVFELPAKVPVIVNSDSTEFLIFPGIRNNGENSRAFIYRLLDIKNFTLPLQPGQEVEKDLVFSYQELAKFDFVEGFEGNDHIFTLKLDEENPGSITTTNESVKSGSKAGKISLDSSNEDLAIATIFKYDRSENAGSDSYFEMDYKCDMPFAVGVIYEQEGSVVTQPLLIVNPSEEWNKIYVDFTEILTSPVLESYRVYIVADIEPLVQETGTIFLDNLKFVHL